MPNSVHTKVGNPAQMTPKELEFLYQLLEETSRHIYARGYADGKAGKPEQNEGFTLSRASKLVIKTNLKKFTEKR